MKKEELLRNWANTLSQTDNEIEINVLTIPGTCNKDGTLRKSYCYNHGYYFHYEKDPIFQAYMNAGFSFVSYDEQTKMMKLKKDLPPSVENVNEPAGTAQDESFQKIDLTFLMGKHFYIPGYQRGYRWLDEARFFVRDISENKLLEYLFQPLVVKKIESCSYNQKITHCGQDLPIIENGHITDGELYELIDGQQRLTTLFLVLHLLDTDPGFIIYYENVREIDNLYMKLAQEIIRRELPKVGSGFEKKLRNEGRFVWYNDGTGRKPEDIFKSLNADKTELTSSELFKALLLRSDNNAATNNLISYQLDAMETELNNEDLWRFISDNQAPANRVQLIFDVFAYNINKTLNDCKGYSAIDQYKNVAEALNKSKKIDSKFAFLSFDNFISALKDDATNSYSGLKSYKKFIGDSQAFWEEIYDIFEIIKSWHTDPDLHNLVGFLLARKRLSYFERIKLIQDLISKQKTSNYDSFKKAVLSIIKEDVLTVNNTKIVISENPADFANDTISYSGKQKNKCYDILLLANVWYAYIGKMPFNFKCLKDKYNVTKDHKQLWDIEHINARTGNGELLKISEDGKTYTSLTQTIIGELEYLLPEISDSSKRSEVENLINKLNVGSIECPDLTLNAKVSDIWKEYSSNKEGDNSISNLTLLSSDINRSYHNDFYNEKCMTIQKKDDQGWFIPTVTKNIFSSRKYTDKHVWNEEAQKKYREELIRIIDDIWGRA